MDNNFEVSFQNSSDWLPTTIKTDTFQLEITNKQEALTLHVTDFSRQTLYKAQLTDKALQQNPQRHQFFDTIDKLEKELVSNKRIRITDTGIMELPVEVQWKQSVQIVRIQLSLEFMSRQSTFQHLQKVQKKMEGIKKMNQSLFGQLSQKKDLKSSVKQETSLSPKKRRSRPVSSSKVRSASAKPVSPYTEGQSELLLFKIDINHPHSGHFQQKGSGKVRLRTNSTAGHCNITHFRALPAFQSCCFRLRPIIVQSMFVGICDQKSLEDKYIYGNPLCVCLDLLNGMLFCGGRSLNNQIKLVTPIVGSVIEVEIDRATETVRWYQDATLLCNCRISPEMKRTPIYPVISMRVPGEEVQLIGQ